MSFQSEWANVVEAALDKLRNKRASMISAICHDVIDLTPVDTGLLKNSWRANIGETVAEDDGKEDWSGQGEDSHTDVQATISAMDLTDTVTFANHRHYAEYIEYDGHSKKAPAGMLRISIAKWPILAEIKSSREGR